MRRNILIVLALIAILILAIWFFCCNKPCEHLVSFYYDENHAVNQQFTSQQIKDELNETISTLNNLMHEYDLKEKFVFNGLDHINHNDLETVLSSGTYSTNDVIRVYLKPEEEFVNAHFGISDGWIQIPITNMYNPTIFFHEFMHKLMHDGMSQSEKIIVENQEHGHFMPHAIEQGFLGRNCYLELENSCLNTMFSWYNAPLNLLVAECQSEWIKKRKREPDCAVTDPTTGKGVEAHTYPKDFVAEIEELVDCCQRFRNASAQEYRDAIDNHFTPDELDAVNSLIRLLRDSGNACFVNHSEETFEMLMELFEGNPDVFIKIDQNPYILVGEIDMPENLLRKLNRRILIAKTFIALRTTQCSDYKSLYAEEDRILSKLTGKQINNSTLRAATCQSEIEYYKENLLNSYLNLPEIKPFKDQIDSAVFNRKRGLVAKELQQKGSFEKTN